MESEKLVENKIQPDTVLKLTGISKSFSSKVTRKEGKGRANVLSGVSLDLRKGEVYGFIGLNGAGKTTTIKIALGLTHPDLGEVLFFGLPPSSETFQRVGFAPEKPVVSDFLTGDEIMDFSARLLGFTATPARKKEVLEKVGLWEDRHKRVGAFSKGMQQRLALGAAMLHDPDFLVLDEPASGLDPMGRNVVKDIIRDLQKEGKTIFFSSHILADVSEICSRIGIIHNGKLVFEGTLNDFNPERRDPEKRFVEIIECSGAPKTT